jgi:MFS family permease
MTDEAVPEGSTIPSAEPARSGMLLSLSHRDFALLWSGQALSGVGNQMFPIILAILVLARGSGATGLGLVLAVQGVSLAAGMALAASVGDRWRRTRVMISTDVVRALGVAIVAISPIRIPEAALLTCVVAIGLAEGMFLPAYGAVLPRVLPEEMLQGGNGLTAMSQYVAMVAGPLLAGGLIAATGPGLALWVDVSTFAASLATLALVGETAAGRAEPAEVSDGMVKRGMSDLAEGVRAVWQRPWLAASIGVSTITMTFVVAPAFLAAPIVAREHFGGATAYGAMFTALGVGSVLGSVVGGKLRTTRPGLIAGIGLFTIAGSVSSLGFLPLPGILAFWGLAGVGVTVYQILWTTGMQRDVPDALLGRVMALDWLGSQALMPLGYALAGVLVGVIGISSMLAAGAVLLVLIVPLPLLVPGGFTYSTPPPREPLLDRATG